MVLAVGIHVLNVRLAVYQIRHRPDEMLTGIKHIQHGDSVSIKGQPVVDLHLAVQPVMLPRLPEHALALHYRRHTFRAAVAEDGRVCHAPHGTPLQIGVLPLNAAYFLRHMVRRPLHALVGRPRAAVQLPNTIQPPVLIHGVPAHGEWPCVAPVHRPPHIPAFRNAKWFNDMGLDMVSVMLPIIDPFAEHLPGEAVPVAVQQRCPLRLRQ